MRRHKNHEDHTLTGAFNLRGGIVYMDRLRRERPHMLGVISATRGNHGQSLAYAGARAGVPVTILVPHGTAWRRTPPCARRVRG